MNLNIGFKDINPSLMHLTSIFDQNTWICVNLHIERKIQNGLGYKIFLEINLWRLSATAWFLALGSVFECSPVFIF